MTLNDYNFKEVESFVYLGGTVAKNNKIDEINSRIMLPHKTFYLVILENKYVKINEW